MTDDTIPTPLHDTLVNVPERTYAVDAAWVQMRARMGSVVESPERTPASVVRPVASRAGAVRSAWTRRWAVGAALSVVMFLVGYAFASGGRSAPRRAASDVPFTTYATANGERKIVTLGDGTRVVLNVWSRLDVPADFGARHRTVHLSGEAAFTVAHLTGAPFTIRAAQTRTAVLGTEFGVRAYDRDTVVQVAVRTGRVSVDGVTLSARDIGRFAGRIVQIQRDQPVDDALGFVDNRLVLRGQTLADAAPRIERWFDVELRFGTPSLASHRWDATLAAGTPADLAHMLEFTLGARVVMAGRVLTLYAK